MRPQGLSVDQRSVRLQELFGDEGKRGLAPLLEGLRDYKQGLDDAAQVEGLYMAKYKEFQESAAGRWESGKQNVGAVVTVLSTALLPATGAASGALGAVARVVGETFEAFPVAADVVGALAVALGVGSAGAAIPAVVGALTALKGAILANPIGLAAAPAELPFRRGAELTPEAGQQHAASGRPTSA